MVKPIQIVCQIDRITMLRDGGGKLTVEFGKESIEAINELSRLNAQGDLNLAAAFVPFTEQITDFEMPEI